MADAEIVKAASNTELKGLHKLVVESLSERIRLDMEDKLPTDAATLSAAIKLLKDNGITADPEDRADLNAMRDQLSERRRARDAKRKELLAKAEQAVNGD